MAVPIPKASLTRDDWIGAGLTALREAGPQAVAVQSLAVRLGATKGSFYWHFTAREDLLDAVLERWRRDATEQIIDTFNRAAADGASPADRLRELLVLITQAGEHTLGEQRILAGTDDPLIRRAVAEVTRRRMDYVAQLLVEAGLPADEARRRAWLAYTWYLGYAQLAATVPGELPADRAERRRMVDDVVAFLLQRGH